MKIWVQIYAKKIKLRVNTTIYPQSGHTWMIKENKPFEKNLYIYIYENKLNLITFFIEPPTVSYCCGSLLQVYWTYWNENKIIAIIYLPIVKSKYDHIWCLWIYACLITTIIKIIIKVGRRFCFLISIFIKQASGLFWMIIEMTSFYVYIFFVSFHYIVFCLIKKF